jgi:hypothetical protein
MTCSSCRRRVSVLLAGRCAACDLDRVESEIRGEFGDVAVLDDHQGTGPGGQRGRRGATPTLNPSPPRKNDVRVWGFGS